MNGVSRYFCVTLFLTTLCLGQEQRVVPGSTHGELHARDSYVLRLNKEAILRGPDFSQRALALKYGKKHHLRDFVWFSTNDACFLAAGPDTIQKLREFEKKQRELNKRWQQGGSNPTLLAQLRREQNEHTGRRDEFIWSLFDELRAADRLQSVNGGLKRD